MLYVIRKILSIAFFVYILLILGRVILSWFPQYQQTVFGRFLAMVTDPYLNLFRSFIPPIKGVDFSATVGLLVLIFVRWIILRLL